MMPNLSRRNFLRSGAVTLLGTAGAATLARIAGRAKASPPADAEDTGHLMPTVVGEVDHERNGSPEDLTIAQVIINDAVWPVTVSPSLTIPRLGEATVHLDYHWAEGEA